MIHLYHLGYVIFVTRHKTKAKNKYERKGASRLEGRTWWFERISDCPTSRNMYGQNVFNT
jgi:hypothetical protein